MYRPKPDLPDNPIIVRVRRETNIYAILGIDPDADAATIKTAYHVTAKAIHPDSLRSDEATVLMQKLNRVHELLSDPIRRTKYDAKQKAKVEPSHRPEKADNDDDAWHDRQKTTAEAERAAHRARQEAERYRRQTRRDNVVFFWWVLCVAVILAACI